MSNLLTKLSAAALLALAASPALAAPGNGIRLGGSEGRLHLFVELEGRYDSNAYTTTGTDTVGDTILHVRPGLTLSVPGEMTSVDGSAKLDWAEYLGRKDAATKDLSQLYASADLGLSVNKKGTVGFEMDDSFSRSDRPQALSIGSALISTYNTLNLKMPIRPGGGALTVDVNGIWQKESYEAPKTVNCPGPDPLCSVSDLGYNQYGAGAGVGWRFLPRTSAVLEANYFTRKPEDTVASATGNTDGWSAAAGLTGLVTPHVAATVKLGYGNETSSNAVFGSLGTFIAKLEGEWLPTETAGLKLSYDHGPRVDPSWLYTGDRIGLNGRLLMASRYTLGIGVSWDHLAYSPGSDTTAILQAGASAGAEITRWLRAELAFNYTDRSSTGTGHGDYTKNEVWLKAVATY